MHSLTRTLLLWSEHYHDLCAMGRYAVTAWYMVTQRAMQLLPLLRVSLFLLLQTTSSIIIHRQLSLFVVHNKRLTHITQYAVLHGL